MPEPQPGPGQPERASGDSPGEPPPAADGAGEPDTATTVVRDPPGGPADAAAKSADAAAETADGTSEQPAAAEDDRGEAGDDTPPASNGGADEPGGTAETAAGPPRWTASAPVPPPAPRKRRWLASQQIDPGAPEPPNRTLELPTQEREALEEQTPVDPWADADDPWGDAAESWTPLPPTLPYPMPPAHPAHPGPPAHPAHPGPPAHWHAPAYPPPPAPPPRVPVPPAPRPGPVPAPPPPAPDRGRKRRDRGRKPRPAPPAAPPPGWQPPKGYVAVPVRRRRRWPWVLTVLTLLCCCGCPGWFGRPMWQQYPASAVVPAEVADLTLRDDPASRRASQRFEADMRAAHALAEQTFAGVYSAPGNKQVTVFGAIGFRFSPEQDVAAEVTRLTDTYQLTEVQAVPGGERGEHRRCGVGRSAGRSIVLCSWADHGSLGTGLFTGRSVPDSAELLGQLRASMVIRG